MIYKKGNKDALFCEIKPDMKRVQIKLSRIKRMIKFR
jgi:hypothetical protein